jgi:hypothetical protein
MLSLLRVRASLAFLFLIVALDLRARCVPYWSANPPTWAGEIPAGNNDPSVMIDFSGDGVPDLAGATGNSIYVAITDRASFSLGPITTFATGLNIWGLAAADVNNDGVNDLITADRSANGLIVFRGNGDGTFAAPLTVPTTIPAHGFTIGDFDGDGNTDIAFRSFYATALAVWKGDGTGRFSASSQTTLASTARNMVAADFDGDAKLDLFVTHSGSADQQLFHGNGDGTLAAPVTVAGGMSPYAVAAGDLNGDNDVDLVTTEHSTKSATVLLNHGNRTFAAPAAYPVFPGGDGDAFDVAISDVDGDDLPDIVLAAAGDNAISTYFGNGDGTFGSLQRSVLQMTIYGFNNRMVPRHIELFDVDGDGRKDLFYTDFYTRRAVFSRNVCGELTLHASVTPLISANDYATVTVSGLAAAGNYAETPQPPKPTGTFTIYDGDQAMATAPATSYTPIDVHGLTTGIHELHVQYDGDANYRVQRPFRPLIVTVTELKSTVNVTANPVAPVYGEAIGLKATVTTPPGTTPADGFRFLVDGKVQQSYTSGTATVYLAAGSHEVVVRYLGNAQTPPASSAPMTLVVAKATPEINVHGTPISTIEGTPARFTVSIGNATTGTLLLYEGRTLLASSTNLAGAAFSVDLGRGRHSLTARFSDNENFHPGEKTIEVEVYPNEPLPASVNAANGAITVSWMLRFHTRHTIERRVNGIWSVVE